VKSKQLTLLTLFFSVFGIVLIGSIWLTPPIVTEAACGAATTSCKTCHEVKGEDPVSQKGDWHTQHSFGDFCQACHSGVATETDKEKAHVGLVSPLTQPDQSCAACHPADTAARVVKYGGTVTGSPTGNPASGTEAPATGTAPAGTITPSAAATQVPPNANPNFDLIDFNVNDVAPWLAWVIGIINVLMLIALSVLIWRWKKGLWPWFYIKGGAQKVPFNTLPPEVQEVFTQLLNGDMKTVLALREILKHDQSSELLEALSNLPESVLTQLQTLDENELKSLSSLSDVMKNVKEGEHLGI